MVSKQADHELKGQDCVTPLGRREGDVIEEEEVEGDFTGTGDVLVCFLHPHEWLQRYLLYSSLNYK